MNRPAVRYIITPNLLELFFCLALAVIVIIINLWRWIVTQLARSAGLEAGIINNYFDNYGHRTASLARSGAGKAVFAAVLIMGCLFMCYGLITAAGRSGAVSNTFPGRRITIALLRLVVLGVLAGLAVTTAFYTLPLWLGLASQAAQSPMSLLTIGALLLSVTGTAVNFYALWVFIKLTFAV